ncbi:MAG: DUF971 domain-containing protein, partial [Chloroflexi bacterium]|nr:DUF971 domain-containing protein [Chloroflexota bacterium]
MAIPTRVEADATQIVISWDDGHQSLHPNTQLREACPCAFCVDERTRERLIQPGSAPRDVRPLKLNSVGRYAINIEWS